jgi:hypothetical protein
MLESSSDSHKCKEESMRLKESWFTEQLALAAKEASTWPDWARREAGLDVPHRSANTAPVNSNDHTATTVTDAESAKPIRSE